MAKKPRKKIKRPDPTRWTIERDSDKLAMPIAAIVATVGMTIGFLRGGSLGFDTCVRIALIFVVTYVAVFLLSRLVLDLLEREINEPEEEIVDDEEVTQTEEGAPSESDELDEHEGPGERA